MTLLPRASLLASQLGRHASNGRRAVLNASAATATQHFSSTTVTTGTTASATSNTNTNTKNNTNTIHNIQQRTLASAAAAAKSKSKSTTLSAGKALDLLTAQNPHVEVIRYHHKNLKFTLKHFNDNAEALAIGLLDTGFRPGDVVLSWLPGHIAEQHILQFACSKAGLILYNLDPSLPLSEKEDTDKMIHNLIETESKEAQGKIPHNHELLSKYDQYEDPAVSLGYPLTKIALEKALTLTKANFFMTLEAGSDIKYMAIASETVKHTQTFNYEDGEAFFTPAFPSLRICASTGFEHTEGGWLLFKDFMCSVGDLEERLEDLGVELDGSTPLRGELIYDDKGIPTGLGKVQTNEEVVQSQIWPEMVSVLKKEYKEIEGVGVVF